MPEVSVIIPTFNREKLIAETLDSLIWQTLTDWECIIVDDGSADRTLSVVKKYVEKDSRFTLILRDREPKGAPTCRNIGLNACSAQWVVFLDSDDLLMPWALKNRVDFFHQSPRADLCLFQSYNVYRNGKPTFRSNPKSSDYLLDFLTFQTTFQTTTPIWRKLFLLKIGGWTEEISHWQDPNLHCKAIIKGAKLVWGSEIPDTVIRFDNIDNVKLTDFSKQMNSYNSILRAYFDTLQILTDEKLRNTFLFHIKNQTWIFLPHLDSQKIKYIAALFRENEFFSSKEEKLFLCLGLSFNLFKRVPVIRSLLFTLIKKQSVDLIKYSPYEDPGAREQFNQLFHNYYKPSWPSILQHIT